MSQTPPPRACSERWDFFRFGARCEGTTIAEATASRFVGALNEDGLRKSGASGRPVQSARNFVAFSRSSCVMPVVRAPTNLRQARSGSASVKP